MADYEVFIIWENARVYEEDILKIIEENFKIRNKIEVKWSPKKFTENLTTFYETDFRLDCMQLNIRGNGKFLFLLVEDTNAKYCLQRTSRGIEEINLNVYKVKQFIRETITHDFSLHSSVNKLECENNIVKLFGKTLEEFLLMKEFTNSIYERNCIGVDGWNHVGEIFKVLNICSKYVVLRMFEGVPDQYSMKKNGDIDILVDDLPRVANILQPRIDRTNNFRFFNWLNIADERVLIHPKYVGDYYYDEAWEKAIIETRIWNGKIYIPSDEMLFWTLIYHGCFHKDNIIKYDNLLNELAKKLNIEYKNDEKFLSQSLSKWMTQRGYKCQLHLDGWAFRLNKKNIPLDLLEDKNEFYVYKSYYSGRPINTTIVSKDLIRINPQLFSDIVKQFDPLYKLSEHLLSDNNSLYSELCARKEMGEYMWRYALRYGVVSELKYIHDSNAEKRFERTFMADVEKIDNEEIIYSAEKNIPYITGTTVDSMLKLQYIKYGREAALLVLVTFIKEVFVKFEIDSENLKSVAWDMLSKNCIKDGEEYQFFDFEAVFNGENIRKVDYIAYELDWIRSFGINLGALDKVYLKLCSIFGLKAGNYDEITYGRSESVLPILLSIDNRHYFEYKRYVDIPIKMENFEMQNYERDIYNLRESIYLDHALFVCNSINKDFLRKNNMNKIIVYGMGKYGKKLLSIFEELGIEVIGCIDRNVKEYKDYKIFNHLDNIPDYDLLIVSMRDYLEVVRELKKKGMHNVIPLKEFIHRMEN